MTPPDADGARVTGQPLHALRAVLLAQSIERADAGRALVSQPELDEALRRALAAASARGVARTDADVGNLAVDRAQAIVAYASGRNDAVAALASPSARLRWLERLLPAGALGLGLLADRIANPHRVDLLSPPLLLVLLWNVCVYALLVWHGWHAWRKRGADKPGADKKRARAAIAAPALLRWLRSGPARRGLAARIAADFSARWLAATAAPLSA